MAVPRDNRRTVIIGEKEYELEASLGTSMAYRNEFFGKLDKPYTGDLGTDMLTIYTRNQREVDGEVDGKQAKVPNEDYCGIDLGALMRVTWAMAWAAGSTKKRFDKFLEEVIHQPAGVFDEIVLWQTVMGELGDGIIFRNPQRPSGAEPSDAAEGAEG